jgi:hypothetical protein
LVTLYALPAFAGNDLYEFDPTNKSKMIKITISQQKQTVTHYAYDQNALGNPYDRNWSYDGAMLVRFIRRRDSDHRLVHSDEEQVFEQEKKVPHVHAVSDQKVSVSLVEDWLQTMVVNKSLTQIDYDDCLKGYEEFSRQATSNP